MKNMPAKPFGRICILLGLLSVAFSFAIINAWLSYTQHDLYSLGRWESTKTKLGKGVWGGRAMMLTNIGLSKEALHLNAWHGNQELTLIDSVLRVQKMSFSAYPGNVTFSLIIDKTPALTTGVLFDAPHQSITLFQADKAGRFISRQPMPYKSSGNNKVKFEALFLNDSLRLLLNGRAVGAFAYKLPTAIRPGFRGSDGNRDIVVDDLEITDAGGKVVLTEKFSYPFHFYRQGWLYLLAALVLLGYCLFRPDFLCFAVFGSWLISGALAICFGYYYFYGSAKYPNEGGDINWRHFQSNIESAEEVRQRVALQYPDEIAAKQKVVLLVGSSQTWGAGARDSYTTFGALLQDSLRYFLKDSTVTVINIGVSGTTMDFMLENFKRYSAIYHPVAVILNVANNDFDTAVFIRNLDAFISYSQQQAIKPLLVEEPNNGVYVPNARHLIMRRLAAQKHIACVEMQSYFISHAGGGFAWWDEVHMTDYGQQLFASRLTPFAMRLLATDSTLR